ncbi:MAG TPA: glycoside hydrolase family 88 protein [Polyangiaceae bacterium]|nr:glycoside hydrolase family 88 protein [Polyangiaceae bacterium]
MPHKTIRTTLLLRGLVSCAIVLWACERADEANQALGGAKRGRATPNIVGSPSGGSNSGASGERGTTAGAGATSEGGAPGGNDGGAGGSAPSPEYPELEAVLPVLERANAYFMNEWPDPGAMIDFRNASNIWTRAVYYEGLLALYAVQPKVEYYTYAVTWGESHAWGLNRGATSVFADDQCAGQTYLDLYAIDPQPERINAIRTSLDALLMSNVVSNWFWVDAIQMSMPALAKFGVMMKDTRYFEKMAALYEYTRNSAGDSSDSGGASGSGGPLYDAEAHLWWRDKDFDPPAQTANGKPIYWSRGNGWVFTGLARVLAVLPKEDPHRAGYVRDFQDMASAIRAAQRSDGFWNVNLGDPDDFGGPELSGTSLFAHGLSFGVRSGLLDEARFKPAIVNAWRAMASAVHPDGFLGYVQRTGRKPSDGQPLALDKAPDLDDFGLGCFLLGGTEIAKLAQR